MQRNAGRYPRIPNAGAISPFQPDERGIGLNAITISSWFTFFLPTRGMPKTRHILNLRTGGSPPIKTNNRPRLLAILRL